MGDYADLEHEIRPHLVNYVREVIRLGRSYYPEENAPFWPRTLAYWRHREAFCVYMVSLYGRPETTERWVLPPRRSSSTSTFAPILTS